ncbi:triosephosphate isomerase [Phakopsora pachyrhizi]|uniref:Triosephosphate isomerase n=1 Tax=Phakopsora pachyrhizi TaxID=170000 RepID=A0AAV0BDA9_PHAPC|nr:triosephosphate isomerase [Phakopsora pachyrhizi]KAI8448869.1 triosephosphate isomerase [Phakopsora pachyrhizi]CAH7684855.1 triosephosphate isomerase [Phakopsora pachyrhizi]
MAPRKFFVGGNFKMNGTLESLQQLVKHLNESDLDPNAEVVVAPPALYLLPVRDVAKKNILVGAQNGYLEKSGAFTGEISFHQLVDAKIPYVILGHSERRSLFHEDSEFVGNKTGAALATNLSVIACIGESLSEREANRTIQVVESQLEGIKKGIEKHSQTWDRVVVAYEPVWAIGTGKVATPQQAQEVHKAIREWFKKNVDPKTSETIRIIYGGSVNGNNCGELSREHDIDGFLVGGASLKPEFVQIVNSGKAKL